LRYIDTPGGHRLANMRIMKNAQHHGAACHGLLNQVDHGLGVGRV
jgi:hypothetical protein